MKTIGDIIEQLRACNFKDEIGHPLENNVAFQALLQFDPGTPVPAQFFFDEASHIDLETVKELSDRRKVVLIAGGAGRSFLTDYLIQEMRNLDIDTVILTPSPTDLNQENIRRETFYLQPLPEISPLTKDYLKENIRSGKGGKKNKRNHGYNNKR